MLTDNSNNDNSGGIISSIGSFLTPKQNNTQNF